MELFGLQKIWLRFFPPLLQMVSNDLVSCLKRKFAFFEKEVGFTIEECENQLDFSILRIFVWILLACVKDLVTYKRTVYNLLQAKIGLDVQNIRK